MHARRGDAHGRDPARRRPPPRYRRAPSFLEQAAHRLGASRGVLLAAIGLATLADLVAGRELGVLAIPPLVAALALGVRSTATVAAVCVAASAAIGATTSGHPAAIAAHVGAVAVVGVLAVWLVRLRVEREHLLARMSAIARAAQEAIVRPPAPHAPGAAFAARYVAAESDARVGGDLYEVAVTPFGVRIVIGDVCGKGLDAVRAAAAVLRAFRDRCQFVEDLPVLVSEIDAAVRGALDSGKFVTAVFAELSPDGALDVVNCGHPAPLCVGPDSAYLLEPSQRTTPLGIEPSALVDRFHLGAGERLLFYTDGLADVGRDAPERLIDAGSRALRAPTLEEALDLLVAELVGDPAAARDDVALLIVEPQPPPRSFLLNAV